jgi:MFS family permease
VPSEEQLETELPVSPRAHDPYAAWRNPSYRLYAVGGFLAAFGGQLQATTIGYEITKRAGGDAKIAAWQVGIAALVQGLPVMLLVLPAGQLADLYDRRRIALCGLAASVPLTLFLAYSSFIQAPLQQLYWCLFIIAFCNALMRPAQSALLPQLVESRDLANAVTWNSTRWQIASVAGPALLGPILFWLKKPAYVYAMEAFFLFLFWLCLLFTRPRPQERSKEPLSLEAISAGLKFVFGTRLMLATLTLDLFAVLLGGAIALLPVYTEHILRVNETQLGWLRAAPALGAVVMALTLAYFPPMRRPGRALLWAVTGFGAATVVFGFSKIYWLSFVALALTGAFDNISVVVRHTLVQVLTPDAMRGRVSAVNSLFISASNELGGFESGAVARFFGPVFSVVSGGIGTIITVWISAWKWPELMRLGRLDEIQPEEMQPSKRSVQTAPIPSPVTPSSNED